MNETYSIWILTHRWSVIAVTILLVALAGSGGRLLKFSTDYRVFFSDENPQLTAFEELQDTYTKNDNLLMVLAPASGDVFTPRVFAAIVDVTERAWQIPYSLRVDSLSNYQHTYAEGDTLTVIDLIEEPATKTPDQIDRIRTIALNEPLLVRRLISPQGHVTAVNVTVELPGKDPSAEVPAVVAKAREIAAYAERTYPEIRVYLSGIVMMNNAFAEASRFDMTHLLPLALLLIVIAVLLQLRGLAGTLATVLVILFSVIAAMGIAGWSGVLLTGPLMSAPTIIMTGGRRLCPYPHQLDAELAPGSGQETGHDREPAYQFRPRVSDLGDHRDRSSDAEFLRCAAVRAPGYHLRPRRHDRVRALGHLSTGAGDPAAVPSA